MNKGNIESKHEAVRAEEIPDFIDHYIEQRLYKNEAEREALASEFVDNYGLTSDQARTAVTYFDYLNLRAEDIKDKLILDVGSNIGEFKTALSKMGIASRLFVNFDKDRVPENLNIRGRAEALPFKDESFDLVLAHASVPMMQATGGYLDQVSPTLDELFRVVRTGGTMRICPVGFEKSTPGLSDHLDQLERLKLEVFRRLKQIKEQSPTVTITLIKIFDERGPDKWRYALIIKK